MHHETRERKETGLSTTKYVFDVCVVGGGMAGLCAAIASARNGAKTVLIHDRPVLGGNASSEVRMWICGARGKNNKETGILEEIQLDNFRHNPALDYCLWDAALWAKASFEPNLTTLLNCSVNAGTMDGDKLRSVRAWQLTTQAWHEIEAKVFVDCSGDSILAPISGALVRTGRESCDEFDEDIQPAKPDAKTMGNTLLIQIRKTDQPQPFTAPDWAYRFESPDQFQHRLGDGLRTHNFWWIELGGLQDTIADAEVIRDDLMRTVYGVWDYLKNVAPEREKSRNWALAFVGSLPGKRENRRYVGDHVLTQNDLRDGGRFADTVAYGGWSMDDHHPAGMLYPDEPTIFHDAPSPYGIPYRCLYSKNVPNLMFAGRNISVTHAALSSTRVMATCAILGQAAGTAAGMCVRDNRVPRNLRSGLPLQRLQQRLQHDDCWLPGVDSILPEPAIVAQISGGGDGVSRLVDGHDRDSADASHAWVASPGDQVTFTWDQPQKLGGVRLVFDSNLNNDKRMPCAYPQKGDRCLVPGELVRGFTLETRDDAGDWQRAAVVSDNHQRLVRVPLDSDPPVTALRLTIDATWGRATARVFAVEPTNETLAPVRPPIEPMTWAQRLAQVSPEDLEPPANVENAIRSHGQVA
ncbi:MAG: FAD-dependent oxidoreductase [Planctomycetota bacterium]